ncbi:MAG: Re/Si-specific NAD(P)(+) transhydrogenase subunit alpha [Deltaproteobacteria bacterium]|nr:Re/Si-specific NAD(P)(+) transhydrogenase subunit alpha [Deltaproteobacteria bacterium]
MTTIKLGVLRESWPKEARVAVVPASIPELSKSGFEVWVEAGAGRAAGYSDDEYASKGARVTSSRAEVLASAVLLQVWAAGLSPDDEDLERLAPGTIVVGLVDPLGRPARAQVVAARGVTLVALEMIPRITRAQSMDVLSSMATISGYKAVLLAAERLPRMFPMLMTAAGTISPARVFVIGAGVAGLQACATAKRLGAIVRAYDVRAAVKEQVQSVGAKFVEIAVAAGDAEDKGGYAKALGEDFYERQRALMAEVVAESDVVITTALIPGQKSPVLVTEPMVKSMARGSVIVDLAAERGGNCALTKPDQTIDAEGVLVLGPTNLPSTVPFHASQMYSKNVTSLLKQIYRKDSRDLNFDDEITRAVVVASGGKVVLERVRGLLDEASGSATGSASGSASGSAGASTGVSEGA